ncbi:MAG TPA: C-terminal binding protein [Dehalococcoidia bacterium]|nr:C-terminal binding protein [Dehalococcoidia bacterium]
MARFTEKSSASFKVVQISYMPGVSEHCEQVFKPPEVEYQMRPCTQEDEIIAVADDADVLMVTPAHVTISQKVIEALPRCRYILDFVSGYDGIDLKTATEHGVLVTNMPDLFWEEVADHTMALILACSRKIVELNQAVKRGEWVSELMSSRLDREIDPKLTRLKGQTLGLVGFGRIARGVAVRAKGFGMKIIVHHTYVSPGGFSESEVESVELNRLIEESDFISIHTMLSEKTRGMFGLEQFKKMKPTAYIINTARGPIIDRDALYAALTQKLISGAALDVTDPEPSTPDNNPLLRLDNVIVTGHRGGKDRVAFANLSRLVPEQVFRVIRGEWPQNIVNPEAKEMYVRKWGKIKNK